MQIIVARDSISQVVVMHGNFLKYVMLILQSRAVKKKREESFYGSKC